MKDVQLTGVPQTLLLPLAANFYENNRHDCILYDETVNTVVDKLDLDLSFFCPDSFPQLGMMVRRRLFDNQVKKYLKSYPNSTVVNLGAGLCTRFFRMKTKNLRWFNIDLPQVEPLWRTAFTENGQFRFIGASAFETGWYEKIPKDQHLLFISEAMLCYHNRTETQKLFQNLLWRFKKFHFIFDVYNDSGVKRSNQNPDIAKSGSALQWGVKKIEDLKQLNDALTILDTDNFPWRYVTRLPFKEKIKSLFCPGIRNRFTVVHTRFSTDS
ncbi:class I SAM-dependent methyltransferase [uncultured Desulfobacter sp.]|uniref:class I SAM-dependent methyltransferase n=1 Tax=uncultured Desulfobacter sp. TaxID=240139 RepID=UPI0029F45E68|nr:class I SAM-dependent methyltransferase [uncultured Desulfobacter sp.]